jgi:pimeloyl-ACP methyl ester carboxylesterase
VIPSFARLNARFDLVSFDPRGVGQSAPVHCLTAAQLDAAGALDTVLDDPLERQTYIDEAKAFAQACRQKNARILPFVDTESSARDLDVIRTAVGDAKLTYLGFSYGTFLGETYAHLFPTHIRALAFDAVIDPATQPLDALVRLAAGFEVNLQALLADCRAYVGCEYAREGDPGARLADLMQRIDLNPIPVGNRMLTRSLATAGVLLSLYDPRYWPTLFTALNDADQGNGRPLLTLADLFDGRHAGGTYSNLVDANTAIDCLDRPGPSDIAAYDEIGSAMAKASPILGPALQYDFLVCAYWPVKARRQVGPLEVRDAPPILLVGGTADPATPYVFAEAVNRQIPGSVLLTRKGYGHPSYDKSFCVREAVDAYLVNLTLPDAGTVCDSEIP